MSKNILILLAFILFPLSSYCEIPNVSDKFIEAKVKIGYDENHFSPLKSQEVSDGWLSKYSKLKITEIKLDKAKSVKENEKLSRAKLVLITFGEAVIFYLFLFLTLFFLLTLLGCALLIVAKIVQLSRKKR
jgi:hypothetical protein